MMKNSQQRVCRKRCATCLWFWPDIHDADSTKRFCHNEGSPFYRRERAPTIRACEAYEGKAIITYERTVRVGANKETQARADVRTKDAGAVPRSGP